MELVSAVRLLARRRLLVAAGVLAAALVGVLASGVFAVGPFGGPELRSIVGYTRLQLDTPNSLLVDLRSSSATIGTQTVLFADEMHKRPVHASIAAAAGIRANELTVVTATAAYPPRVSPLATTGASVAAIAYSPYVLTIKASTDLPVVGIEVAGPDIATVGRLAQAPVEVLQQLADARAPNAQARFTVRTLTPVSFTEEVVGGGRTILIGIGAFVALSILWGAALVVGSGVMRLWRRPASEPPPARA